MVWSKDLFVRQDNGGSVPAACFDRCNQALLIASDEGLKSQLCASNSPFLQALDVCSACIKAQGTNPSGGTSSISSLLPFLEFCHLLSYSTLTYTSTNGQITTIVYLLPTNHAATTTSSSPRTTTTTSTLAPPTSPAPQNTASSPSVSATPQSHAWIAGPIVGSIVGLAIVFGVLFYLWRRQHRHSKPDPFDPRYDRAQLHSDDIPKPELDAQANTFHELDARRSDDTPKPELDAQTNTFHELDAQPAPPRAEMPANEAESVAADVSETGSRSNAKAIARKPIQNR
ncbi:hypothetical protein V8C34DRAFT_297911 [Trichoderma compactum]